MKIHTSHLWTFSWPDQAASYREPCWPCAMFSPAMPWQSPCTARISYMCVHLFMCSVIYIYIYISSYMCVKHIYVQYVYIYILYVYLYIYIYSISWLCHLAALWSYATRYQHSCPSGLPEWSTSHKLWVISLRPSTGPHSGYVLKVHPAIYGFMSENRAYPHTLHVSTFTLLISTVTHISQWEIIGFWSILFS